MPSLLSKSFTILRGGVYSAAFVWLWTWLAISVRSLDTQLPVSLPNWLRPLGFVLASAGALLAGICRVPRVPVEFTPTGSGRLGF
jgi:hypothetical protein